MQIINIWVNGCFDVLHIGHIELLKYAKSLGIKLIVGIDTDERVKAAKGPQRPFNNLQERKRFLESIRYVDQVVSYSTDEELELNLKENKIDVMVIGSDWKGKRVIGEKIVKKVVVPGRLVNFVVK